LKQIYLGLAIHNHQPLGNFPWVFEQAYQQAYSPMVEALERHQSVCLSLHYSGCLIDWLEQNHPEFLDRLAALISRKQVEIMGGAYYEPILPAIPDADKLGQIDKMTVFIKRRFGDNPTGMWLAERVWEPHLAKTLAEAGMEWTLIDDNAFKSSGLEEKNLFGYYLTEEQGHSIKVFPISKYLRYSIPWHDVEEVIDYLGKEASDKEGKIAILGDDGEKFGVWPGTFDYCWQKGWVEKFFTELEANQDWLHTMPLVEYARRFPSLGRIYLPCAAYDEMLEWSLPADKSWEYTNLKHQLEAEGRQDITQFMYSGIWRNFLVKYPEINRMHKKMLRVHRKVYQARAISTGDCGLEELWKAQCNCPYWHGVFGGIYLADIRATTYGHLVQAESEADSIIHGRSSWLGRLFHRSRDWLEWQKADFDGDGDEELLVDSDALSVYLSPAEGGSIFEWDVRRYSYNLCGTLARRPEAYHRVLTEPSPETQIGEKSVIPSIHELIRVKDKDALRYLVYDKYLRSSLIDHFLSTGTKLEDFAAQSYSEVGDFAGKSFEFSVEKRSNELRILLWRNGILNVNDKRLPFEVQKEMVVAREDTIHINYRLKNISDSSVKAVFGSEWNINLLGGGHNEQAYYCVPGITLEDSHLDSWGELSEIEQIILGNRHLGIELELTVMPKVSLWRFPVESVSNSEGGIERIYQESCLVMLLPLDLPPGGIAKFNLVWQSKTPLRKKS
jgi:alpha-amylase